MAGLFNLDPQQAEMLATLGMGLLGGQSPNFGANALQAALYAQQQQEAKKRAQLEDMKLREVQQRMAQQDQIRQLAPQFIRPGAPLSGPLPNGEALNPTKPSYDLEGFANAVMPIDAMQGLGLAQQAAALKAKAGPLKVGKSDRLVDPATNKVLLDAQPDLPTGMVMGSNGPQYMSEYLAGQEKIRAAGRPQVSVDNRQENEFNKKIGAEFAEKFSGVLASGAAANSRIKDLQRFDSILKQVPTGKLEPFKAEVAKLASGLGLKVDTNKLGFQESLDALANQFALTLRNPASGAGMPGALSDKDREFLVSMVPGLGKTPEGNRLIIEAFKRVSQREIEVAKLARDYKKANGKFDEGFYDLLEQRFGSQDLLGDLFAQASQSGARPNSPQQIYRFDAQGNPL